NLPAREGMWTQQSAAGFAAIAATRGQDIRRLMDAVWSENKLPQSFPTTASSPKWDEVYNGYPITPVVAELVLQTKTGQTIRIALYDHGKTIAGFNGR